MWLASLCCCLLSNKLVLHAEYLPLYMCVSVCVCGCACMWLFARGFVGSRHCLLALFQLGEVHVVAIVRIQVRNSSPFCLLPSPFATLHYRFPIQLGTHAKRTKVRTVSFLPGRDSSIPIMFPIPPVPCPLHRVRHCLQGPLYFQTRLQRTLLGFPFETHTLSLKQFSPVCPSPACPVLSSLSLLSFYCPL